MVSETPNIERSRKQFAERITTLIEHLASLPTDAVETTAIFEKLLADIWDELGGSSDGGMAGYKLHGRIETAIWEPPHLRFTIERHGGTALGSSRAEIQRWVVNLQDREACMESAGYRQLVPRSRSLSKKDVEVKTEVVKDAVITHRPADFLEWSTEGTKFKIVVSKLIPATNKQTTASRRKRLRKALREELEPLGWHETSANRWSRG